MYKKILAPFAPEPVAIVPQRRIQETRSPARLRDARDRSPQAICWRRPRDESLRRGAITEC
jgi:hypothetical protein